MKVSTQQQTREELAWRDVGHTHIRSRAAWTLVLLFWVVIFAAPLHQHVAEYREATAREAAYQPVSLELIRRMPDIFAPIRAHGLRLSGIIDANRIFLRYINEQEDLLEDESLLGQQIRPTMQEWFSRRLGVGNEQAYVGRDGWLFFRPGMDYLTGPGFLNERQLARRAATGTEWRAAPQPDPRKAMLDFKRQLDKRGITLIVMPTPIKPSVHPEQFSARYANSTIPLHNPSYAQFLADLEANGVLVFDPTEILLQRKAADRAPQYLAADTHWRPEAMEAVAKELAEWLSHMPQPGAPRHKAVGGDEEYGNIPPSRAKTPTSPPPEGWPKAGVGSGMNLTRHPIQRVAIGDIALMLDLPEDQALFPPEPVTLQQVVTGDGQFWRPSEEAEILVLGDSFSNIYSLEPMGCGESAGFIEQLSYHLDAPVDRLVRNDSGAFATRDMLSRELARGRDRLARKRVIIWQFAARELSVGDWRLIPLDRRDPPATRFLVPEPDETITVTGVVQEVSPVPRPGTVPYRDHIVSVHLVELPDNGQAVIYMHSMLDNEWTRAARLRIGEEITVTLRPWSDVADRYDGINRSELDDWELQLQEPCWGEWTE